MRENLNVLLICDVNPRACIAIIRALDNSGITALIGLREGSRKITTFINYVRIRKTKIVYYNDDSKDVFINSMLKIKEQNGSYLVLPTGEKLMRWALSGKALLSAHGITIPTVSLEIYELVSNKASLLSYAKNFGLLSPPEMVDIPEVYQFPYVVKPKKFDLCDIQVLSVPFLTQNPAAHKKLLEKKLDLKKHFIQEYLDGPSFYYCALYVQGVISLRFAQQTLIQEPNGGSVIKAIPCDLPEDLIQKIDSMFNELRWNGVMMLELKKSDSNFYLIECNPRFWGPLQCAIDNDVNFPLLLIENFSGKSFPSLLSKENLNYKKKFGYVWTLGYLNGLIRKIIFRSQFQRFHAHTPSFYSMRDIWLRGDSYKFFLVEFLCIIYGAFRQSMKFLRSSFRLSLRG